MVIGNKTDRSDTYDLVPVIYSTIYPGSDINGDFGRKLQFFHLVYLTTPLRRFPLEFRNGCGAHETTVTPRPECETYVDMCIRFNAIPVLDGQKKSNIVHCLQCMLTRVKKSHHKTLFRTENKTRSSADADKHTRRV